MKFSARFTLLILVLCFNDLNAEEAAKSNPFRAVLDAEELGRRISLQIDDIANAIYLADKTLHPAVGTKLFGIRNGSNADKAGIENDSIIVQRGEQKSWGGYFPPFFLKKPSTVEFITPSGANGKAELGAGLMGGKYKGEYHLEIAYLRGEVGIRNKIWDRQMLVACMFQATDAKLAETALHHAIKLGYKEDVLTDFFQVIFQTISKNGPEKSMEKFLAHFEGKEIPWIYIPPLQNVIAVTGRIDYMKRIADQAGDNAVFDSVTIKDFLTWTGGKTKFPQESLVKRVVAKRGELLNSKFKPYRDGKKPKDGEIMEKELQFTGDLKKLYYCNYHAEFKPNKFPHNIHYQATIKLAAVGLNGTRFPIVRMGFSRLTSKEFPIDKTSRFPRNGIAFYEQLLYLDIMRKTDGTFISTSASTLPGLTAVQSPIFTVPFIASPAMPAGDLDTVIARDEKDGKTQSSLTIDLIRLGSEIGLFIDGIPYIHIPTNPDDTGKFMIHLDSFGTEVEISDQELWELKD